MPPNLPLDLRPSDAPLLVGVSGGRDSTVLLHRLVAEGVPVEAAHVNYGLRGADSDADEAFVRALCARLGVPLHVHRVPPSDVPSANRQAWARGVRYTFFGETATARSLATVAVAHHADDQAETVLLGLLRGRSLASLRGMQPRRWLDRARFPGVVLVRPLLGRPRADVQAYAEAHGLAWREDASNNDRRYRRNALRHDLLPRLETLAPGVAVRLVGLAAEASALHRAYRRRAMRLLGDAVADDGTVSLSVLRQPHETWAFPVLMQAVARFFPSATPSHTRAEALFGLIDAQPGRRVVWPEGTVWRERNVLRFVPETSGVAAPFTASLHPGQTVALGTWTFAADAPAPFPGDPCRDPRIAYVPLPAFPLAIRPWQAGERLDVLGASGMPRISGLLTRAKVPPSARGGWPLVLAASGEALWLPGVRLGQGCRLAPGEPSVRVVFSSEPQPSAAYL